MCSRRTTFSSELIHMKLHIAVWTFLNAGKNPKFSESQIQYLCYHPSHLPIKKAGYENREENKDLEFIFLFSLQRLFY